MSSAQRIIARKYAQALLNIHVKEMTHECYNKLIDLRSFFKEHQHLIHYLYIPTIPDTIKEQVLNSVFTRINTCSTIKRLVAPLLKQRRIELLEPVLDQLIDRYRLMAGIVMFNVATSHPLTQQEKDNMVTFLAQETGLTVWADFNINTTLLCGFRAESKTFLFERSLGKKIRDVKTSLYQRIRP